MDATMDGASPCISIAVLASWLAYSRSLRNGWGGQWRDRNWDAYRGERDGRHAVTQSSPEGEGHTLSLTVPGAHLRACSLVGTVQRSTVV